MRLKNEHFEFLQYHVRQRTVSDGFLGVDALTYLDLFLSTIRQVIIGPETDEGPWYFSLNNRRLWVFKRLREEGLLPNNQIAVRVRAPKSDAEKTRYSLENCALEAKLMREGPPGGNSNKNKTEKTASAKQSVSRVDKVPKENREELLGKATKKLEALSFLGDDDDADKNDSSSDDSSVGMPGRSNPFSLLG